MYIAAHNFQSLDQSTHSNFYKPIQLVISIHVHQIYQQLFNLFHFTRVVVAGFLELFDSLFSRLKKCLKAFFPIFWAVTAQVDVALVIPNYFHQILFLLIGHILLKQRHLKCHLTHLGSVCFYIFDATLSTYGIHSFCLGSSC